MEKIPTVDELLVPLAEFPRISAAVKTAMIAFTRIHVQAALKAASEKAQIAVRWGSDKEWKSDEINTTDADGDWILLHPDKDSILNAYPLENIK